MSAKKNFDKHTDLMLRFQKGDECAFRSLLSSYKNRVYSLCYRFFQNQAAAEACCQTIFYRLYNTRQSFHPEGAFSAWLFSIANQVLQDSQQTIASLSIEPVTQKNFKNSESNTFEAQVTIRRAMAKLSTEERMVILLDQWERFSISEIADIMNRNPLAVESILFKARAKLRIKLAAYLEPAGVR